MVFSGEERLTKSLTCLCYTISLTNYCLGILEYRSQGQASSKIIKTRYVNLILSLDFTCRNQLQQTLHVCRFWQVCISCNLLSLGIIYCQKSKLLVFAIDNHFPVSIVLVLKIPFTSLLLWQFWILINSYDPTIVLGCCSPPSQIIRIVFVRKL